MIKRITAVLVGLLLFSGMGAAFATEKMDTYFELKKYELDVEHSDVLHIQNGLKRAGYLDVDTLGDVYDEQVKAAITAFQKDNGLTADGIAGRNTIEKMFELNLMGEIDTLMLKPGNENLSVKELQEALMALGYLDIDESIEYYGKQTTEAVRAFQSDMGLTADGIAGTLTLHAIQEAGCLFLAETYSEGETETLESLGTITKDMLIPGVHHQEVALIQQVLYKEGCLETDTFSDFYGEETEAAVKAFQEKYNLKADGVAGMETIAKMIQLGYVNQVQVVSRQSSERRFGEYLPWSTVMEMIDKGKTVFVIEDFYTGTTFKMLAAYGGVHSDVEPLTAEDAHIIKSLWGGEYSWIRRPVLVHFNGRVIAASLNGMPHAGMDNTPEGQYINVRSGGYGYGYNFDSVKGNDFDGHLCLHFKDSKLHANRKIDEKHQKNVRIAAGLE